MNLPHVMLARRVFLSCKITNKIGIEEVESDGILTVTRSKGTGQRDCGCFFLVVAHSFVNSCYCFCVPLIVWVRYRFLDKSL